MMIKHISITVVFFLLFLLPAASLTTLTYQETEKVALNISTFDPDKDFLTVAYASPLDKRGEWQTSYGDAGIYHLNITVSDGSLMDSEEVLLIINRKEVYPTVQSYKPLSSALAIDEGKGMTFSIRAIDLNKDELDYVWALDGVNFSRATSFRYDPGYDKQGMHRLEIRISDGVAITIKAWDIEVRDVDLDKLILARITDVVFEENEIVRLALPDFRYYKLSYGISSPLESNYWKTDYNSSGTYKVEVRAWGNGYDSKKTIRLTIRNADRPPVFSQLSPQIAYEGQKISLTLKPTDPDGDTLSTFMDNPLEGAVFRDGVFSWTPSYDEVQNAGTMAGLERKFHLLSKVVELQLGASSNSLTATLTVPITIFNVNRAPVLKDIAPLTFNEGDIFFINPKATDPDNDPISFSYGTPLRIGEPIPFDAAGAYAVKVSVSDGFLEDSQVVQVNITNKNRAPQLSLPPAIAFENQTFRYTLNAIDADNDELDFSIANAPKGMVIKGKTLEWIAPISSQKQRYSITIMASDGSAAAVGTLNITVSHKNRPPIIQNPVAEKISVKQNTPLLLVINATDPDGDPLHYEWRFGRENYAGSTHQRTFSTKGEKRATAMVSDGKASVEKTFTITVI